MSPLPSDDEADEFPTAIQLAEEVWSYLIRKNTCDSLPREPSTQLVSVSESRQVKLSNTRVKTVPTMTIVITRSLQSSQLHV